MTAKREAGGRGREPGLVARALPEGLNAFFQAGGRALGESIRPVWYPDYSASEARGDLLAGLTVGVVLVPQGMAYAVLAGVPPIYGLYASLLPLLVYPLIGTSRHLAVGVNAVSMVIVAAGVARVAEPGTGTYVGLVLFVTLLVGAVMLAMGTLRLGFLAELLSRPVITGFTAAAGLLIVASQLGALLGVEVGPSDRVWVIVLEAARRLDDVRPAAVAIGGIGIVAIVAMRAWKASIPAELLVLVAATAASAAWGFGARGIEVVGTIPTGLPAPVVPPIRLGALGDLWPTVVSLALVQFLMTVSIGRSFAARHGYGIDPNRELVAIGTANLVGGLFRSLPVSGSFSRTAVNERAGARTPLANVGAVVVVALTLLFFTPLFRQLPLPALAAIIVVAGAGLLDWKELRFLFRAKRSEGWVAGVTFLSTLVLGIEEGILIGVALAVMVVLAWLSRPNVAELGIVPGTQSYRSREAFGDSREIQGVLVLRVDAGLSFFNAEFLKEYLLAAMEDRERPLRAVVLDGMSVNFLDTTAVAALQDIIQALRDRGVEVYLTGLTRPVREVVRRSGLGDWLGEQRFFMSPHQAVEHLLRRWDETEGSERLARYRSFTETEEEAEHEARAEDTRFS